MKIHLGGKEFSIDEAGAGLRYAHFKFGFEVDKSFLLRIANEALEKVKRCPDIKFKVALKEALLGIRFQEKEAYASAIAKMFSNRSLVHRFNQRRHAA